jgi:hypothetical protein
MDESNAGMSEAVQAVVQLAQAHYSKSDEPFYLAAIGQALRGQKLWPIDGGKRSLKEWLKTLEPGIFILQDETKPARVAIVTPEKKDTVERILMGLRHSELVHTLARPVLLAFCVRGADDSPVFLTRNPPFRYTLVEPNDLQNYHAIPAELRVPGLKLTSVSRMAPSDVARLGERIQAWSDRFGVALNSLTQASAESAASVPEEVVVGTMSALDRLISAQRQDLRTQLVIPADIAALLSRQR